MSPSFRATWTGLALLALAAWLLTGNAGDSPQAEAQTTLRTPRLGVEYVALLDEEGEEEGDEDFDHEEDEDEEEYSEEDIEVMIEELEVERVHLEVRRAELQAAFGELELIQEISKIAEDPSRMASLAVLSASDAMEPEELIPFLQEVASNASSAPVRRVAKLKLAEAYEYTDQRDLALKTLRGLALGE